MKYDSVNWAIAKNKKQILLVEHIFFIIYINIINTIDVFKFYVPIMIILFLIKMYYKTAFIYHYFLSSV